MIRHLRSRNTVHFTTVCGLTKAKHLVPSVEALLAYEEPCKGCLEWVVEQGQIATRHLENMRGEGASQ